MRYRTNKQIIVTITTPATASAAHHMHIHVFFLSTHSHQLTRTHFVLLLPLPFHAICHSMPCRKDSVVCVYPETGRGGVRITEEDLDLLKPGEFLNDSIIEFYIK